MGINTFELFRDKLHNIFWFNGEIGLGVAAKQTDRQTKNN
jgi:hypothetical protein